MTTDNASNFVKSFRQFHIDIANCEDITTWEEENEETEGDDDDESGDEVGARPEGDDLDIDVEDQEEPEMKELTKVFGENPDEAVYGPLLELRGM